VLSQAGRGPGMNVAQQANLKRDPLIQNVLGEVPQFHALPSATAMSSINRVPCPMRCAPQY